jgi:signal transduction histidine kinase/ActR/RegA family two-component response regulator
MLGQNADTAADPVLVFAPGGRDAEVICRTLASGGLTPQPVDQLSGLLGRLERAAAAVVAEEGLLHIDRGPLAGWVAGQPPWSDFPFILLTLRGNGSAGHTPHLIDLLGNVTVLERPLQPMTLLSAAQAAQRARRRQRQAYAFLQERERAEARMRELAASLERRVEERTRQLSQANDRLMAEIGERERAESVLLQAQKMEAIGQLTGGVAHDFNNLLTAVVGNLDLLAHRVEGERQQRLVRNAMRAAERGAKLTEQLLAFSRRQRLMPGAVDVNALMAGMGDLLSRTIGATIRVETDLQPGLWTALADPHQLELVILNLAINARDAMPGGGRLTIETKNVAAVPGELAGELVDRHYVEIAVADSGIGMPADVLARVFEPFFTTKPYGRGTGLGLSQVYGFAKQSGGTVRIDSVVGEGTRVRVYLPRTEAAAQESDVIGQQAVVVQGHAVVLIVDDDADVRELVVAMLQDLGYRVLAADGGGPARAILDGDAEIDLLLVDVAMPGISGVELARHARLRRPDLPVLFASGYADMDAFGTDLQWEDLIKKPYRAADLAVRVQEALRRAEGGPQGLASNVVNLRKKMLAAFGKNDGDR